ncbi:MAG: hypothetical protein ACK5M4_14715 [Pseudorhodobacter sp.]
MGALIRLAVVAFILMTVFYVLLSIYLRSLRREELEKEWDLAEGPGQRDDYIESGMASYAKGLWYKLLWLVYIIPTTIIIGLVYFMNFA